MWFSLQECGECHELRSYLGPAAVSQVQPRRRVGCPASGGSYVRKKGKPHSITTVLSLNADRRAIVCAYEECVAGVGLFPRGLERCHFRFISNAPVGCGLASRSPESMWVNQKYSHPSGFW